MLNATLVGRIFNGKGYDGKKDDDRRIFRARLNYRDPMGEYQWIDAVCFRDFGDNNGLVGFLEENFSASGDDNGGQGIIVVGHIRPTKRKSKRKVPIVGKKNGKTVTKEIEVEFDYESFEFVIEQATFPPKSKGESSSSNKKVEVEEDDFDFDEDLSVGEPEEDTIEEEPKEKRTKSEKKTKTEKKKSDDEDDDDDFFEE